MQQFLSGNINMFLDEIKNVRDILDEIYRLCILLLSFICEIIVIVVLFAVENNHKEVTILILKQTFE